MRWRLISPSLSSIPLPPTSNLICRSRFSASSHRVYATADGVEEEPESPFSSSSPSALGKDLKKVVNKTAATFAPRASTASKNPALPGTTLYKVFEVQGYASMLVAVGGLLSFNLLFSSTQPDLCGG